MMARATPRWSPRDRQASRACSYTGRAEAGSPCRRIPLATRNSASAASHAAPAACASCSACSSSARASPYRSCQVARLPRPTKTSATPRRFPKLLIQGLALPVEGERCGCIALLDGQRPRARQRPGPGRRRRVRTGLERPLQPVAALADLGPRPPEFPERPGQPQPLVPVIARGTVPLQGRPEVVNLSRQTSLPGYGRRPLEVRRLRQGQAPVPIPASQLLDLAGL